MPAGLDGNPDPLRTPERDAVLDVVVDLVASLPTRRRVLVAIDGIDGSGKSTFADEVVTRLQARPDVERTIVRATVDSFHNPRVVRHARGPGSAEGFYRDTTNVDALTGELLDPFREGRSFRTEVFDEPSDSPVDSPLVDVPVDALLVVDGIFGHRAELRDRWDLSVFLDGWDRVERGRIVRATADCPADPLGALLHLARWWVLMRRYVEGQRRYLAECDPMALADVVIDNDDLAAPRILRRP